MELSFLGYECVELHLHYHTHFLARYLIAGQIYIRVPFVLVFNNFR